MAILNAKLWGNTAVKGASMAFRLAVRLETWFGCFLALGLVTAMLLSQFCTFVGQNPP